MWYGKPYLQKIGDGFAVRKFRYKKDSDDLEEVENCYQYTYHVNEGGCRNTSNYKHSNRSSYGRNNSVMSVSISEEDFLLTKTYEIFVQDNKGNKKYIR